MKAIKLLLLALSFSLRIAGVSQGYYPLDSIFGDRPEVYFSVKFNELKEIEALSHQLSIDKVHEQQGYLLAYANRKQFEKILANEYQPALLTPPSMTGDYPVMLTVNDLQNRNLWNAYPTYEAYEAIMNQFATDYPELCTIHTIATLNSGRKLLVARIQNSSTSGEPKPEVYYTATIHGDELAGFVLKLRLIDYLLSNYGTNSRITSLVDNLDIWISPNTNPDGTYAGGNHTVWGSTRGNANGIDLNRNYPDPRVGENPDGNPYQPETVALMEFESERNFVLSANEHGGIEVANYPWDTWSHLAADDAWWVYVTREYADTAQFYSPPGYFTDLNNGITNGYAWYSITGGRQDYMNYFRNCREFTLELTSAKRLPEAQLPSRWEYNYRSFLNYLEQALFGVRGVVTNGETNAPIKSRVSILNHDQGNSHVYSALPNGNYHRLLKAGTYDLQFSALGYHTRTFENVVVNDREATILNVQLFTGELIAGFSASAEEIAKGEAIDFFDESFGENIVSWAWSFEGAQPPVSAEQNPNGIQYPETGSFDVSLTVTNDQAVEVTHTKENFIIVSSNYRMRNGSFQTCEGQFFDSGGQSTGYQNNEDFVLTFHPEGDEKLIKLTFTFFDIESHINCDYDFLQVFDGTNTLAPLLGTWCGTNSPGELTASNPEGALTIRFKSDGSVTGQGWTATIECTTAVGLPQMNHTTLKLFPNPMNEGVITVEAPKEIMKIYLIDNKGAVKYVFVGKGSRQQILQLDKLESGLYLVSVVTANARYKQKLLVK